jgi:hypothetical protein
MAALLRAISRRNLETDAGHILTPEMMKHKVPACPAEIYRFNKSRRRGDAAWDWAPEDIFRRLCIPHKKKAPKGVIALGNRKFSSPELAVHARAYESIHNGVSVEVKAYEIPNAPFAMLWELPGHGLGLLEATPATKKIFEEGLGFSVDYQEMFRNHLRAEAKFIALKEAQAAASAAIRNAKASAEGVVSKEKQAVIDTVERNAAFDTMADSDVETAKTKARRYKERQDLNSQTSEFGLKRARETEDARVTQCGKSDDRPSSIDDEQDLCI